MQDANYFLDVSVMPLFNWRKCQESQSYEFCRKPAPKSKDGSELSKWTKVIKGFFYKQTKSFKYTEETDSEAWVKIYD